MACELAGIFRQLRAVGRQRELIDRAGGEVARERGEERHDSAPNQRFSAGEAELPHSARNEGAAQPVELFKAQKVGLGQERHVLRHAIDAAEIAPIGHRDAQIGDRPSEWINQASGSFRIEGGRSRALRNRVQLHILQKGHVYRLLIWEY
jgi:hypothetical protein